jgi:hypothetical protein
MKPKMNISLIAPCGMNCALCMAYLREKNRCPGCRLLEKQIPISIARCMIRNCKSNKENQKYCSKKCCEYPCPKLMHLDRRYRTKYGMSMIENLNYIQKKGIRRFLKKEKSKWIIGDKIFCVHKRKYYPLI